MEIRNAEHYPDLTASKAIAKVAPPEKKVFTLAYKTPVGVDMNTPGINLGYGKSVPISEMNMDEIVVQLKRCHKSHGDPEVCRSCMGGCAFGTRAVELLNLNTKEPDGRAMNGQKTMRRAILEYQRAVDSGDPLHYILDHMKSKLDSSQQLTLAKQKLKRWERNYGAFVKKPVSMAVPEKPERKRRAKVAQVVKQESKSESAEMLSKAVVHSAVAEVIGDITRQIERISKEIQALASRKEELSGYLDQLKSIA